VKLADGKIIARPDRPAFLISSTSWTGKNVIILDHVLIYIYYCWFVLRKWISRQIINRDSPKPVPLTWLFMHCLGSSKFVVSEKKIFIHIPIGSYVLVKLYHVEAAALDFWSTEKRKFCKRVFNDFSCTIWAQSSYLRWLSPQVNVLKKRGPYWKHMLKLFLFFLENLKF
jgi:hypothetical protein